MLCIELVVQGLLPGTDSCTRSLICANQCSVPTAVRTLAHDDAFVKESHHSVVALDALALGDYKGGVATGAGWAFLAQGRSVVAGKAKEALFGAADGAVAPDDALEIAALGAGVMFDRQFERDDAAGVTFVRSEKVGVVWVALGGDLFSGKGF